MHGREHAIGGSQRKLRHYIIVTRQIVGHGITTSRKFSVADAKNLSNTIPSILLNRFGMMQRRPNAYYRQEITRIEMEQITVTRETTWPREMLRL